MSTTPPGGTPDRPPVDHSTRLRDEPAEAAPSPQVGAAPAESAEAPRTPEEIAAALWPGACVCKGDEHNSTCARYARSAIAVGIRAALAARDAEWRKAFEKSGLVAVLEDDPEPNEDTNPLRALLSEGKPGK